MGKNILDSFKVEMVGCDVFSFKIKKRLLKSVKVSFMCRLVGKKCGQKIQKIYIFSDNVSERPGDPGARVLGVALQLVSVADI